MRLRHCHIPGVVSYAHGDKIQQHLVRQFLSYKASSSSSASTLTTTSNDPSPPPPTILTLQFSPVYTSGRREIGAVSASQQAFLRANGRAAFHETQRGGLLTHHSPGQLVAYPVLDLKQHRLSPRSYVCLLEKSVIAACARWGIATRTTENTGVWVTEERKIASIGIHLRRHVASHGVGLNVNTDLAWFDRIEACGLADKKMTSFEAEGVAGVDEREVGRVFVQEMASRMSGVEDVVDVSEDELMAGV